MNKAKLLQNVHTKREEFLRLQSAKIRFIEQELDNQLEKAVSHFINGDFLTFRITVSFLSREAGFLLGYLKSFLLARDFKEEDFTIKHDRNALIVTINL